MFVFSYKLEAAYAILDKRYWHFLYYIGTPRKFAQVFSLVMPNGTFRDGDIFYKGSIFIINILFFTLFRLVTNLERGICGGCVFLYSFRLKRNAFSVHEALHATCHTNNMAFSVKYLRLSLKQPLSDCITRQLTR